jgi:hypothetical protein
MALMLYVSPHGNDKNDGLSWDTPKCTIRAGVKAARKKSISDSYIMVAVGTDPSPTDLAVAIFIEGKRPHGSDPS